MRNARNQETAVGPAALVVVGLLLTPIFGVWGWLAIAFATWSTWKCLTAFGRS